MDSYLILAAAVVAFTITAVMMFALRPLAKAVGLVDIPGGRKHHRGEVPIVGGIAMFFGMFAGLTLLPSGTYEIAPLFAACGILVIVGMLDDRWHLPTATRLSTQIAVVLIMIFGANLTLETLGDPFGVGDIELGHFSLLFTLLVALTVINAYNLIDGVDGLAGTLALIALLADAAAAGASSGVGTAALIISAAILGFLTLNFPAAGNRQLRAFMGDAGSTLLGFAVVWITIHASQGPSQVISPVLCLWFASIPVYDCLTCFVRRIRSGVSPFTPGRDHFHHTLLHGGFRVRETLGILMGLQTLYALLALAAYYAEVSDVFMFFAWAVLGLLQRFSIKLMVKHRQSFLLRQGDA